MSEPHAPEPTDPEPSRRNDGPDADKDHQPVDRDSPASTLFNEGEDAVEPNEPG
jgi:hypothetical protein